MKEISKNPPRNLALYKNSQFDKEYSLFIVNHDLVLMLYFGPDGGFTGNLGDCIRKIKHLLERHPGLYTCTTLDSLMERHTLALLTKEQV